MFEDIQQEHCIRGRQKILRSFWNAAHAELDAGKARTRSAYSLLLRINAHAAVLLGEERSIAPRPAAYIQDEAMRPRRTTLRQQRCEDAPARREPPVLPLQILMQVELCLLHSSSVNAGNGRGKQDTPSHRRRRIPMISTCVGSRSSPSSGHSS